MIKKTTFFIFFLVSILIISGRTQALPRYIFFFIGDGFGAGALTYAENIARQKGETLCFSKFPVGGSATTHSANNLVTCSSAAGTALASGYKTKNNMLNISPDSLTIFTPITKILQQKGYKIGIATSVSIDHATPAAYYAHSIRRNNYYQIAKQIATSEISYFAGAGLLKHSPKDSVSVFTLLQQNNYSVSRSLIECAQSKSVKNILIQPVGKDSAQFPYAINKSNDDFTLAQVTALGIDKLKLTNSPFFFMVEGGLIDWANHDNLAAELNGEVVEFSDAIEVALQFYQMHPNETLIVVTSDHESGGSFVESKELRFSTKDHSGNCVPVFAIGVGAEKFGGFYDNTQFFNKILSR